VTDLSVPFINLGRTVTRIRGKVLEQWETVLDNLEFVAPPRVGKLENELKESLSVENVFCCANGTDAITLALQAAGIGTGSKVGVPNLTFWASYEAIVSVGATPVLIDIDAEDLQLSFEELQVAHSQYGLSAIVFPHLYGFASLNLEKIRSFCRANEIKVIEDGAQCYGVRVRGEEILSGAEIGTLSFYPAKVIGGCMDGGAVLGANAEMVALARKLGNHGRSHHYSYSHVGWNSRMGGLQAAFISEILTIESEILSSRRSGLQLYKELYDSTPAIHDQIEMKLPGDGVLGNGYLSVFLLRDRDADPIKEALQAKGIGCGRTYPETISQQVCCAQDLKASELLVSGSVCRKVLNLPLFAFITAEECERSFKALVEVLSHQKE
jgi:UDP-2-acetamido-2-deoxy-ribo-hexuluronate aminotransferase